jgi:hypothetical protein
MKNWPLWSLFAVAFSLSIVLAVPDFRRVVVPSDAVPLICAVAVAWIFVLTRAIEPTLNAVSKYTSRERARRFVVSPLEQECHWNIARQPDGSYITQFTLHFLIRNRLGVSLCPTDDALLAQSSVANRCLTRPYLLGHLTTPPAAPQQHRTTTSQEERQFQSRA